ncbi:MAG TPA: hypothetical protein VGM60_08880 [Pseudonocardia sp.]|uniref:hypothetical protein n=1 Tax=Pseudonocardia sp. TaxID=60912 RepID=UPI002F414089
MTECLGDSQKIRDIDLAGRYKTASDPAWTPNHPLNSLSSSPRCCKDAPRLLNAPSQQFSRRYKL